MDHGAAPRGRARARTPVISRGACTTGPYDDAGGAAGRAKKLQAAAPHHGERRAAPTAAAPHIGRPTSPAPTTAVPTTARVFGRADHHAQAHPATDGQAHVGAARVAGLAVGRARHFGKGRDAHRLHVEPHAELGAVPPRQRDVPPRARALRPPVHARRRRRREGVGRHARAADARGVRRALVLRAHGRLRALPEPRARPGLRRGLRPALHHDLGLREPQHVFSHGGRRGGHAY